MMSMLERTRTIFNIDFFPLIGVVKLSVILTKDSKFYCRVSKYGFAVGSASEAFILCAKGKLCT